MMNLPKSLLSIILGLAATSSFADPIQVSELKYSAQPNQNQILLSLTDSTKHHAFVMDGPPRLVVDLKNAFLQGKPQQPGSKDPLFSKVKASLKNTSDLRLVIELKQPISGNSHRLLVSQPDAQHLLINLQNKIKTEAQAKASEHTKESQAANSKDKAKAKNKFAKLKRRFVIAIDAGHGGDDPGAQGPNGTEEKQVTLAIAQKLAALINSQPGLKAKLTRKDDEYIGLRDRIKIARQMKADLFISIHADAFANPEVRGASVYTLSNSGASSEAASWLANRENAKEKVGGASLNDKDNVLAAVLLDLSQTATQQASVNLAGHVLKNFDSIGELHYDNIQKAGFVVLKSPDIPSILVETAFISNPSDELNLLSTRYQNKIAGAIFNGILNYFEQMETESINKTAKL